MPKVVITHAVQDIDRWLQGKAERAAAIESGTGSNVVDYVAQDGSNNIAICADVADVERDDSRCWPRRPLRSQRGWKRTASSNP